MHCCQASGNVEGKEAALEWHSKEHTLLPSPHRLYTTCLRFFFVLFLSRVLQNTFVPGVIQLAEEHKVYIGGDDFKSGQTKMKSVMVDFLVRRNRKKPQLSSVPQEGGPAPPSYVTPVGSSS